MKKSLLNFACLYLISRILFENAMSERTFESTITVCSDSMLSRCDLVLIESRQILNKRDESRNQHHVLVCPSDRFDEKTLGELKRFERAGCHDEKKKFTRNIDYWSRFRMVIVSSPRWPIINQSMRFFDYYRSTKIYWDFGFCLAEFKGFDIDSKINLVSVNIINFCIQFKDGLGLYKNNRLVNGCEDIRANSSTGFIFQTRESAEFHLKFDRPGSKRPVCSLFFRNAQMNHLTFAYMINSYYLKSILTFVEPIEAYGELNSKIVSLDLQKTYDLVIDSKLLNAQIFSQIVKLEIVNQIKSIESGVFKPFKKLKTIMFEIIYFMPVIRRHGIEWIKQINSDLDIDRNKPRDPIFYHFYVAIELRIDREFFSNKKNNYLFQDEDFCLFVDFPFRQLVKFTSLMTRPLQTNQLEMSFSCTEIWLYQYDQVYEPGENGIRRKENFLKRFNECRLQDRVGLCQKSHFQTKLTSSKVTSLDLVLVFEYSFIILAPILSILGMTTNLLTIWVIFSKQNIKTMREKHYLYLSVYCLSNVIICINQIMSLMSECQYPFGFYCSSIHKLVGIQYVKVIFVEYLNSACRLFSNFAYFGFAVCRLAKIGKDHGKLIVHMNDLSIKKYVSVTFVISAGISVCKALNNQINNFNLSSNVFPQPIFQFLHDWQYHSGYVVIFALNFIFNLFTYFLFVFIHLIVDIILIKKLIRVLREKEAKMREMKKSEKEMESASKENEESKRRAVFMVVLNSTLNFLTRAPLMVTTLNDLRILIEKPFRINQDYFLFNLFDELSTRFTLQFYCSTLKACMVFQSFGNCLYLLSLFFILFFLKSFDKNFKTALQTCLFNSSDTTKPKLSPLRQNP